MKRFFALLVAAALVVCSFSFASAKNDVEPSEGVGMSIKGFSCQDIYGNTVTDQILEHATVTVINYWATWCGPCVSEMPHFSALHQSYSSDNYTDVQIIGAVCVSGSCTPASAKSFLENHGYTWLNVIPDSVMDAVFNTSQYIPQTLIVDHNGVVRDHVVGSFSSQAQLKNFIDGWLSELSEEYPPVNLGDIDFDGSLTVSDALAILRMGMQLIDCDNPRVADFDQDGTVSVTDAVIVLRHALSLL